MRARRGIAVERSEVLGIAQGALDRRGADCELRAGTVLPALPATLADGHGDLEHRAAGRLSRGRAVEHRAAQRRDECIIGQVLARGPPPCLCCYYALKRSAVVEYARVCGEVFAKAHPRTADAAVLFGYAGCAEKLDVAIATLALTAADQVTRDWNVLAGAIKLQWTQGLVEHHLRTARAPYGPLDSDYCQISPAADAAMGGHREERARDEVTAVSGPEGEVAGRAPIARSATKGRISTTSANHRVPGSATRMRSCTVGVLADRWRARASATSARPRHWPR